MSWGGPLESLASPPDADELAMPIMAPLPNDDQPYRTDTRRQTSLREAIAIADVGARSDRGAYDHRILLGGLDLRPRLEYSVRRFLRGEMRNGVPQAEDGIIRRRHGRRRITQRVFADDPSWIVVKADFDFVAMGPPWERETRTKCDGRTSRGKQQPPRRRLSGRRRY